MRYGGYEAADGSKVWEFETGGEIMAGCNFHGTNVLIGSHDATLYCLSADGKKVSGGDFARQNGLAAGVLLGS